MQLRDQLFGAGDPCLDLFEERAGDSPGTDVHAGRIEQRALHRFAQLIVGGLGDVILSGNGGFMNVGSGFPFDVCPAPTSGNHIDGNLIADSNSGGNTISNNTVDHGVLINGNTPSRR